MCSTYDSWLCEMPIPSRVHHDTAYPDGFTCSCGCEYWEWDADALAWTCEDCGDYLDQGAYRVLSESDLREEARLAFTGL